MPKLIPWSLFKQFLNKQTYLSFKDDDFAFSNKKTNTQNNCTKKLADWEKNDNQFYNYFKKQWVDSVFSNWQIFVTPAGYLKKVS